MATPVWGIRGGDDGKLADRFVAGGYVAVGFPDLPDGRTLERFQVLRTLERAEVPAAADVAARFQVFLQGIAVGDAVLMPDVGRHDVVVGIVEGGYEFDATQPAATRHRRAVRWVGRHGREELPPQWVDLYRQRPVLKRYEAATLTDHVAAVLAGDLGRPAAQRGVPRTTTSSRSSSSSPRAPRAPRAARTPKAPERQLRTCPGCGFNLNLNLFEGHDLCRDCRA